MLDVVETGVAYVAVSHDPIVTGHQEWFGSCASAATSLP